VSAPDGTAKRAPVQLRPEQRAELARVAGRVAAETGQPVTLGDAVGLGILAVGLVGIDKLIAAWLGQQARRTGKKG
jgi:hypothetical protein